MWSRYIFFKCLKRLTPKDESYQKEGTSKFCLSFLEFLETPERPTVIAWGPLLTLLKYTQWPFNLIFLRYVGNNIFPPIFTSPAPYHLDSQLTCLLLGEFLRLPTPSSLTRSNHPFFSVAVVAKWNHSVFSQIQLEFHETGTSQILLLSIIINPKRVPGAQNKS